MKRPYCPCLSTPIPLSFLPVSLADDVVESRAHRTLGPGSTTRPKNIVYFLVKCTNILKHFMDSHLGPQTKKVTIWVLNLLWFITWVLQVKM
jgi:hypothetical protein